MNWSKLYSFLFLFFALMPLLNGQSIDSLLLEYEGILEDNSSSDSLKLFSLTYLVDRMAYQGDHRVDEYLEDLTEMVNKQNTTVARGLLLKSEGRVLDRSGQNDRALEKYFEALDTLTTTNIEPGQIAFTYILAGFLLSNSGDSEKCLQILQEGQPYAEASQNPLYLLYILDYYGDYNFYSAFEVEDFPTALQYYLEVDSLINLYPQLEPQRPGNLEGLSSVYYRLGNVKEGQRLWQEAADLALSKNDFGTMYALHSFLGEISYENGENAKAIRELEKALEYAKKTNWIEMESRGLQQLYYAHRDHGNYEKALNYFELFRNTQDSMNKIDMLNRYTELEAQYESEKKEQLITALNNKNLRQTRNFLLGTVLLSLLTLGIFLWLNRRLSKANQNLMTKNKEILEAQIVGQTIERKRVASELHDNLNTKVAAIRWQLQALESTVQEPMPKKIIDNTLTLVNDVYGDIRLISHNLMPEEIESKGLVSSLSNLLNQLSTNNKVDFKLIANSEELDFPTNLTYPLYNITFELINNILKHSQAQKAWISISQNADVVVITISDDGKGFDTSENPSGVGLKNIHSRVNQLGGDIDIDSKMERGTKVTITVPI